MAEGVRFELTVVIRHAGFQDRCLKPLGHPSTRENYTIQCCNILSYEDENWLAQLASNNKKSPLLGDYSIIIAHFG